MLVSYEWLKKYVDIDVSAEELADKLTLAGITVDLVHHPGAMLSNIIAGKIMAIDKHPDADKLVVCQLYVGEDYKEFLNENGWLQIVTGAPNVRVGQIVPVALHNSSVVDKKIKKSKLRGVASYGMLCSKEELNVQPALTDVHGIWILDDNIKPGTDCIEALWLDDPVLELDLTPNRTDCMSVINLAREVSAVLGTELHLPEISYQESERKIEDLATVEVKDADLCPRYIARMIEDLHIAPSPYWIQHCLGSAGIRSISNVVDISNFVMLEYGSPMHTFDYDTLQGHGVIVRRAKEGEKIITLDEQERELNSENLFICDASDRPICVAGVMGGLNTEITDETKNVLLEVAAFNHVSIRRTSRALGLHSEASQRYEKGVNIALLDDVSRRTIQLLAEYCGGKPVAGSIDRNVFVEEKNVVKLRPARVNTVLGTNFTEEEILSCMQALKFNYTKDGDGYQVEIPSYRQDIFVEVDLIEEVARLQGFDKIPTTLPYGAMTEGKRTPKQRFLENIKAAMVRLGGNEIINYGFISPHEWDRLALSEDDKLRDVVKILNPLNEEQSIMRTSLLPGVLKTASRNNARRNNDLLIFEVGAVFIPQGEELPNEVNTLAVLGCGQASKNWYSAGDNFDFFRLKGMLEAILSDCRITDASFKPCSDLPYMHPGRTAALYLGDEYAGYIGELHPQIQRNYEIKQRSVVLEINLDVLFEHVGEISQYQSLPKFPAAVRDIAVVLDKKVSAAELEAAIAKAGGKHLVDISLFDVYENISLGLGRRSLAYNLTFQCPDRTLTVEEVNEAFEDILIAVQELGGELRS
jgi:phenylalanyl-tRNA synthetase beta chain